MKIFTYFTIISIGIALLFSLFYSFSATVFINVIFIIGMITLIYSGFRLLYEKGAFAFTNYALKRVGSVLFKKLRKDDLENKKVDLEDYLTTEKFSSTFPLFYASLLMVVVSIIAGFIMI